MKKSIKLLSIITALLLSLQSLPSYAKNAKNEVSADITAEEKVKEEKSKEKKKKDDVDFDDRFDDDDDDFDDRFDDDDDDHNKKKEKEKKDEKQKDDTVKNKGKKFTKEELENRKKEYKDKKIESKEYFAEIKINFGHADNETKKLILAEIAELKALLKDYSIGVFVKGLEIDFGKYDDVKPKIENDRTLVPIRAVTESLGAEVEWNAETETITITKDENEIVLRIGSNIILVNGEEQECEAAPKIENNRTLVPLRIISEALNEKVEWDENSKTIIIESEEVPAEESEEQSAEKN